MLLFRKHYPARCFGMYMQNSRLQNRICSREFKTHRFALLQDNASWTNLLTCTAVCAFAIINMGTVICHSNRSVRTGFFAFFPADAAYFARQMLQPCLYRGSCTLQIPSVHMEQARSDGLDIWLRICRRLCIFLYLQQLLR